MLLSILILALIAQLRIVLLQVFKNGLKDVVCVALEEHRVAGKVWQNRVTGHLLGDLAIRKCVTLKLPRLLSLHGWISVEQVKYFLQLFEFQVEISTRRVTNSYPI